MTRSEWLGRVAVDEAVAGPWQSEQSKQAASQAGAAGSSLRSSAAPLVHHGDHKKVRAASDSSGAQCAKTALRRLYLSQLT